MKRLVKIMITPKCVIFKCLDNTGRWSVRYGGSWASRFLSTGVDHICYLDLLMFWWGLVVSCISVWNDYNWGSDLCRFLLFLVLLVEVVLLIMANLDYCAYALSEKVNFDETFIEMFSVIIRECQENIWTQLIIYFHMVLFLMGKLGFDNIVWLLLLMYVHSLYVTMVFGNG